MAEAHEDVAELPLDPAGVRLRRAREAAGLSRADIAARTKIAERHLASIEEGNFAALASRAYAVGFCPQLCPRGRAGRIRYRQDRAA